MPRSIHEFDTRSRSLKWQMLRRLHQATRQLQRPDFGVQTGERASCCNFYNEKLNLGTSLGRQRAQTQRTTLRIEALKQVTAVWT